MSLNLILKNTKPSLRQKPKKIVFFVWAPETTVPAYVAGERMKNWKGKEFAFYYPYPFSYHIVLLLLLFCIFILEIPHPYINKSQFNTYHQ